MENYADIIELLDVDDDLINALVSRGCFTQQQLSRVVRASDQRERCMKLLDMLLRSSMGNFNQFVKYIGNTWFGRTGLLKDRQVKKLIFQITCDLRSRYFSTV
jgi:bacterioferritin-associated ferredoxin